MNGARKSARKTTSADRRKVFSVLAEHSYGIVAMINLRDGIRLGHLDEVAHQDVLDDLVAACGGKDCVVPSEGVYDALKEIVFRRAEELRFRRLPAPDPCGRLCVVLDINKLREIVLAQKDKQKLLDDIMDAHGAVKPYMRDEDDDDDENDYRKIAAQIVELHALDGGCLGKPPKIVWASCHTRTCTALTSYADGKQADEVRNLLGLDCYRPKEVLFLIDLPYPTSADEGVRIAAPTVFEAVDLGRFKSRYDVAVLAEDNWGRTADLGKAYRVPLPDGGADGLPEVVLTPVKISDDYGLMWLGNLGTDTPGTVDAHVLYLLADEQRHDIVEALVA